MDIDIVVEREGQDDILVTLPHGGGAETVVAAVLDAVGIGEGENMLWELAFDSAGVLRADASDARTADVATWLDAPVGVPPRIEVRPSTVLCARRRLESIYNVGRGWWGGGVVEGDATATAPAVAIAAGLTHDLDRMPPLDVLACAVRAGADDLIATLVAAEAIPAADVAHTLFVRRGVSAAALLAHGVGPDPVDNNGRTPLMCAAGAGDLMMVSVLLTSGAEVNAKDSSHRTPLMWAVENGEAATALALLAHSEGVDVDAATSWGCTPLIMAAKHGMAEVCEVLLERRAGATEDRFGDTPLITAAREGHRHVCAMLAAHGFDVDTANHSGQTPLYAAAKAGCVGTAAFLVRAGARVDAAVDGGGTPLHAALAHGHEAVAELLLCEGRADVNSRDADGATPLLIACRTASESLVLALIAHGADVSVVAYVLPPGAAKRPRRGLDSNIAAAACGTPVTPLCLLAERGMEAAAMALVAGRAAPTGSLASGADASAPPLADITTPIRAGMTPLHLAARHGLPRLCLALVACGVAIDRRSADGSTPLLFAAEAGLAGVCSRLMDAGAAADVCNTFGLDALSLAAKGGHLEIVHDLLSRGADVNSNASGAAPLHLAARRGAVDIVARLLLAGADASLRDKAGITALMAGAKRGDHRVCRTLLAYNADIDARTPAGHTAVSLAVSCGHEALARVLLQMGADPWGVLLSDGSTLMHMVAHEGHATLCRDLLVNRSVRAPATADIDGRDALGRTPLYNAAARGHTEVCRLLLAAGAGVGCPGSPRSSPLSAAARGGHEETCVLLLQHGAEHVEEEEVVKEGLVEDASDTCDRGSGRAGGNAASPTPRWLQGRVVSMASR